jgi:hypothetical protein
MCNIFLFFVTSSMLGTQMNNQGRNKYTSIVHINSLDLWEGTSHHLLDFGFFFNRTGCFDLRNMQVCGFACVSWMGETASRYGGQPQIY